MKGIELRHLRHFVAVADRCSFSEAARSVYISQPALTRSIQHLERTVGSPLLRRDARKVSLTPPGERFLQFARMIMAEWTEATSMVASMGSGTVGEVCIGMEPLVARRVIEEVILRCRADFPGITLRIRAAPPELLLQDVQRRSVDFACLGMVPDAEADGLVVERLFSIHDAFVAASTHALAARRGINVSELAVSRWALLDTPHTRETFARYFTSQQVPVPPVIRTNSVALIRGLVLERGFVSLLPREVIGSEFRRGAGRVLHVPQSFQERFAALVLPRGALAGPAVAQVVRVLRALCVQKNTPAPSCGRHGAG